MIGYLLQWSNRRKAELLTGPQVDRRLLLSHQGLKRLRSMSNGETIEWRLGESGIVVITMFDFNQPISAADFAKNYRCDDIDPELEKAFCTQEVVAYNAPTDGTVSGKFKLHSLNVANGASKSRNCDVFYPDEEVAMKQAENYVTSDSNCPGIVIYKAIKVVRRRLPDLEVLEVK